MSSPHPQEDDRESNSSRTVVDPDSSSLREHGEVKAEKMDQLSRRHSTRTSKRKDGKVELKEEDAPEVLGFAFSNRKVGPRYLLL